MYWLRIRQRALGKHVLLWGRGVGTRIIINNEHFSAWIKWGLRKKKILGGWSKKSSSYSPRVALLRKHNYETFSVGLDAGKQPRTDRTSPGHIEGLLFMMWSNPSISDLKLVHCWCSIFQFFHRCLFRLWDFMKHTISEAPKCASLLILWLNDEAQITQRTAMNKRLDCLKKTVPTHPIYIPHKAKHVTWNPGSFT